MKNYIHHSISEIKKASKNLTKFKKNLRFKKFRDNINSVDYDDHGNYDGKYYFANDEEYRTLEALEHYLKSMAQITTNP